MEEIKTNGQAFLCTNNIYKRNTLLFTANQLYYIDKHVYLLDNEGTHRNYSWYMDKFVASPDNDKIK